MRRLIMTGALVLALGFTGPLLLLPKLPVPDAPRAFAQEPMAADLIQELAERLLAPPYGPPGGQQSIHLIAGDLPPELAIDFPLPAENRLIGSAVRREGNRTTSIEIVMDVPGSSADALAFYHQALTAAGWYVSEIAKDGPGGGFQPTQIASAGPYCQSQQGPWLSLSAFAGPNHVSDVRASINLQDGGPCSLLVGKPVFPPGYDLLPPLYPPAGVDLQTVGGGGGPGRLSSEAVAATGLRVSSLEGHFAAQLRAAGWTRIGGRADGPLAWSLWQVPGEGEWQGFLYALEGPGANQRSVYVKVESATQMDGPFPRPFSEPRPAQPAPATAEPPTE